MNSFVIPLFSAAWFLQAFANLSFILTLLLIGRVLSKPNKYKFAEMIGFLIFFQLYVTQFYFDSLGLWSRDTLPLEFCSLMSMIAGISLYTRNHWFYEISLFLGMITPCAAFVFPAIHCGTDPFIMFLYFFSHCLTVFAPLYCTFILGMRPRVFGWYRSIAHFIGVVPVMMTTNYAFGTNFMFLAEQPIVGDTLIIGAWPTYIFVWMALIALGSFVLSACMRKHPL